MQHEAYARWESGLDNRSSLENWFAAEHLVRLCRSTCAAHGHGHLADTLVMEAAFHVNRFEGVLRRLNDLHISSQAIEIAQDTRPNTSSHVDTSTPVLLESVTPSVNEAPSGLLILHAHVERSWPVSSRLPQPGWARRARLLGQQHNREVKKEAQRQSSRSIEASVMETTLGKRRLHAMIEKRWLKTDDLRSDAQAYSMHPAVQSVLIDAEDGGFASPAAFRSALTRAIGRAMKFA